MRPAAFVVLIVLAASCARAGTFRSVDGVPFERIVTVGDGISVRTGPLLTTLAPDQRFRFVEPEVLAMGLGADDMESLEDEQIARWRTVISSALGNARWVESADSAQVDVAIFTTARLKMGHSPRIRLAVNSTSTCGAPSTTLQLCTDDPLEYTEQWGTEYSTVYIVRRRSDGATRVWRRYGVEAASDRSAVVKELQLMVRRGMRSVR